MRGILKEKIFKQKNGKLYMNKKRKNNSMRKIVYEARNGLKDSYPSGEIYAKSDSDIYAKSDSIRNFDTGARVVTKAIAISDHAAVSRNYSRAFEQLKHASYLVNQSSEKKPSKMNREVRLPSLNLTPDTKVKYAEAIQRRAYRLANRIEYNPALKDKVLQLAERVKGRYGTRPSSLEATSLATTSIIGVLGGLFFLSNNITGNAIGNLSNSTSINIGGFLFALGLVAGFFWFKERSE